MREALGQVFPLSRRRVLAAQFDAERDDPLHFLHPHEAKTAELFALLENTPETIQTTPPFKSKWAALRSGNIATRFQETFGYELTPRIRKGLEENPAFRAYVKYLQTQSRDAVIALMQRDALDAYDDHKWSRKRAKEKDDYKETRLAAADHLDRIGATQKPTVTQQSVVVILKGRNYDEKNLLAESTEEIEVEIVQPIEEMEG